MRILELARSYVAAGLSVIPITADGSKKPDMDRLPLVDGKPVWFPFQSRLPTDGELVDWFDGQDGEVGIAILGGLVSGNLEIIDIDEAELVEPYLDKIREVSPELLTKLTMVSTPRSPSGMHLYYRVAGEEAVNTGHKLAGRDKDDPKLKHPYKRSPVLIETRGEANYVLAPGCPGRCHTTGKLYRHINGPQLVDIQSVTLIQQQTLHMVAKFFDRRKKVADKPAPRKITSAQGRSPIDHFDQDGPSWMEILAPHGWELVSGTWEQGQIKRPRKDTGVSATIGIVKGADGSPLFHNFSTSSDIETGSFGKARLWAAINCGGDLAEATRRMRVMGFGDVNNLTANRQSTGDDSDAESDRSESAKPKSPSEPKHPRDTWEPPIPLQLPCGRQPPFPLEFFPHDLQVYIREIASALQADQDMVAGCLLGTIAGSIGGRFILRILPTYTEVSNLYLMLVADPGSAKSPVISTISKPLNQEYARRRRNDPEAIPTLVDNITVEKLAEVMEANPTGALVVSDELSGWFDSFNAYRGGKGSDKQFFLSAYSGAAINVLRKSPGSVPIHKERAFLTIVGGIQPAVLQRVSQRPENGINDGFFDRFLYVPVPSRGIRQLRHIEIPRDILDIWPACLEVIWSWEMAEDQNRCLVPREIGTSRDAFDLMNAWYVKLDELSKTRLFRDANMNGVLQKMQGTAFRLAMISELMHRIALPDSELLSPLTAESTQRAIDLGDYFIRNTLGIHQKARESIDSPIAHRILEWISKRSVGFFTRRQLMRSNRNYFPKSEQLDSPLKLLTDYGWIAPLEPDLPRKPCQTFQVHPQIQEYLRKDDGSASPPEAASEATRSDRSGAPAH